jgi:lipopolysaccharide/colanic/teichoic acid biosynthesis glycosyltransferase
VLRDLMKRLFDLLVASLLLIGLLPLWLVIVIAIRIDSPGPILFRQQRLTKGGRPFTMLKFRTMIDGAEHMHTGLFSYEGDPRITRVGSILRKTSLDELPQLLNVLRGDMSIVGPRPPVIYELGDYDSLSEEYKKRFSVLPGITGLAQVSGRNELDWDEKVRFDNLYVELLQKRGVFEDLRIVALTVLRVLKMKGIVEPRRGQRDSRSDEEVAAEEAVKVIARARARDR